MKNYYIRLNVIRLFASVLAVMGFALTLSADNIVLKSGKELKCEIIRTVGDNVTVRTEKGFSTFQVGELDQEWVDSHYGKMFTKIPEASKKRGEEGKGIGVFLKGLTGQESLAKAMPFLNEHRKIVLYISGGLAALGLTLCFFGWKLYKISTILSGIMAGILLGFILGGVLASAVSKTVPVEYADYVKTGVFLIFGIPFAWFGALFGRRYAMYGARVQALNRMGSSWMGALFALTRFAFFDLSIIWGHSLFGAVLLIMGVYPAVVLILNVAESSLQSTFIYSVMLGIVLCILGAVTQIRTLRSAPGEGCNGEY